MELFRGWIRKADGTYGKVSPMTLTQMLSQQTALELVTVGVTDLEQSTGLKDENGQEVFDGDIVKSTYKYAQPKVSRVFIEHGTAYIVGEDLATGNEMLLNEHIGEVTVVGNIHENIELLEVK